jgi:hypothetical protein
MGRCTRVLIRSTIPVVRAPSTNWSSTAAAKSVAVTHGHDQAAPGEVRRVAPMPGAQLQHAPHPGGGEQVGRVRGGRRGLPPVHSRVLAVGGLPVPVLRLGQIASSR